MENAGARREGPNSETTKQMLFDDAVFGIYLYWGDVWFFDPGSGNRDLYFHRGKNQRDIWSRTVPVRCHLVGI